MDTTASKHESEGTVSSGVSSSGSFVIKALPSPYAGSGKGEDPFVVNFLDGDSDNPRNWPRWKKTLVLIAVAFATLAVPLNSSAYAGAIYDLVKVFTHDIRLIILGISLYVLGFALGPLVWGPLSELYGRRRIYLISYSMFVLWCGAAIGAPNITALLIFRFLQGTFGSSMLVNAGGVITDIFNQHERGFAMAIFSSTVFVAPVLGPVLGGFVGDYAGWEWLFAILTFIPFVMFVVNAAFVPETYGPVLLRRRAKRLAAEYNAAYITEHEARAGPQTLKVKLVASLTRPLTMLFREPIVMCISFWMAIVYGTLYLCFEAFPIVFQLERGWTSGFSGMAFIGIAVGMTLGVILEGVFFNPYYKKIHKIYEDRGEPTPPEARLPGACLGGILAPAALFAFAWTAHPTDIHWAAPIILAAPFGTGMVCTFISANNYIVDTYMLYAASALAASGLLRSLFGFGFPLFASDLYESLGVNWATSVVAFLSLICTPLPFIFYIFGARIRSWSKITAQSDLASASSQKLPQHHATKVVHFNAPSS